MDQETENLVKRAEEIGLILDELGIDYTPLIRDGELVVPIETMERIVQEMQTYVSIVFDVGDTLKDVLDDLSDVGYISGEFRS